MDSPVSNIFNETCRAYIVLNHTEASDWFAKSFEILVLVDEGLPYEFCDVPILHTSFARHRGKKRVQWTGDRLQEALKVRAEDV